MRPSRSGILPRPFYLGTEIAQSQYRAVSGVNPSSFNGADGLLAEGATCYDAIEFCNKPSERKGLEPY